MKHETFYLATGVTTAQCKLQRALLWTIIAGLLLFIAWAYGFEIDEVAVGEGRVIPASKAKVIQSLEGGILTELKVQEGDLVEQGQELAILDPVQARSSMEETATRIDSLQARAARLDAEMRGHDDISFPPSVMQNQALISRERQLLRANRAAFAENMANLRRQVQLAQEELDIAQSLLKTGASNQAEVLRLRQKQAELATRTSAAQSEYHVALKLDYTKTMAELEPLTKIQEGRADQLRRTVIVSPTKGIVKDIRITTTGGVVAPGGVLLEIVPQEDRLLVETRLSPRDIAFIHPDQETTVKITAYDSAVFGTMNGRVERISPDTIEDQVDRRVQYYRAYVRTDHGFLEARNGKKLPILPGMVATTEIRTGRRTVLSYLVKPLNRAAEALRER